MGLRGCKNTGAQTLWVTMTGVDDDHRTLLSHKEVRYGESACIDGVRNGSMPQRTMQTGMGPVAIRQARVNDKRLDEAGKRMGFASQILPPRILGASAAASSSTFAFFPRQPSHHRPAAGTTGGR